MSAAQIPHSKPVSQAEPALIEKKLVFHALEVRVVLLVVVGNVRPLDVQVWADALEDGRTEWLTAERISFERIHEFCVGELVELGYLLLLRDFELDWTQTRFNLVLPLLDLCDLDPSID